MGRPSKPVALILQEGKSQYSKATLEYRRAGEKALSTGNDRICESPQVKADKVAHLEFLRLKRLYARVKCVEALDQQIINRYCQEISDAHKLQAMLDKLNADLACAEEMADRLKIYDLIHKTGTMLNKAKDMLIKLEDRLFLNPSTRIRAVPKTLPTDEVDDSPMARLLAEADRRREARYPT